MSKCAVLPCRKLWNVCSLHARAVGKNVRAQCLQQRQLWQRKRERPRRSGLSSKWSPQNRAMLMTRASFEGSGAANEPMLRCTRMVSSHTTHLLRLCSSLGSVETCWSSETMRNILTQKQNQFGEMDDRDALQRWQTTRSDLWDGS